MLEFPPKVAAALASRWRRRIAIAFTQFPTRRPADYLSRVTAEQPGQKTLLTIASGDAVGISAKSPSIQIMPTQSMFRTHPFIDRPTPGKHGQRSKARRAA